MRGKLNGPVSRTEDYSKTDGMLTLSACAGIAEIELDLTLIHVLRMPNLQYNACMRLLRYAAAVLLCLLLAACGDPALDVPAPTSTAAPTLTPTATAVPPPTPTPAATPTPSPTSTPIPLLTATATVAPTAAPTLTPVSESAPDAARSALAADDSAREILSAALEAMQAADAFHADVDASFKIVQTEASFQMDEETFGDEFPIYYKGDIQAPDRTRGKLGISLGFFLLEIDIITNSEGDGKPVSATKSRSHTPVSGLVM